MTHSKGRLLSWTKLHFLRSLLIRQLTEHWKHERFDWDMNYAVEDDCSMQWYYHGLYMGISEEHIYHIDMLDSLWQLVSDDMLCVLAERQAPSSCHFWYVTHLIYLLDIYHIMKKLLRMRREFDVNKRK